MAVKFNFEEPNGAHFSDTGTFMLNHDDGTDIFTLSKYKRVNFREVKE